MRNYMQSKMVSKPQANPSGVTRIPYIEFLLLINLMGDCTAPLVVQQNGEKIISIA